MARPKMDEKEKKIRVNVTINQGSREIAKLLGMNLSTLLENAIVTEYKNRRADRHIAKIEYSNEMWKKIIEKEEF